MGCEQEEGKEEEGGKGLKSSDWYILSICAHTHTEAHTYIFSSSCL